VAFLFVFVGTEMRQNVESYNVGGIPTSDFFRIISSDFNTYYIYSWVFLIGGGIGLTIGFVLIILFALLQGKESITKSKVKNIFSQNDIKDVPAKDDAINILRTRYAKGEITKKQFEEMKKDLED